MISNRLALSVSSPEKAGVGGSIPSLATTFSNTYKSAKRGFRSIPFHKNKFSGTIPGLPTQKTEQEKPAMELLLGIPHHSKKSSGYRTVQAQQNTATGESWTGDPQPVRRVTELGPSFPGKVSSLSVADVVENAVLQFDYDDLNDCEVTGASLSGGRIRRRSFAR